MEINCETCPVREIHCADCIVNLFLEQPRVQLLEQPRVQLLEQPRGQTSLLPAEKAALEVLVKAGLVGQAASARVVQIGVRASA
jgi:hypothetical protein